MSQPKSKSEREKTQPAEEWGERVATGRAIARGGKKEGAVPGAVEQAPTNRPNTVKGEHKKMDAVRKALARLGENADDAALQEAIKVESAVELDLDEITTLRNAIRNAHDS